MPRSTTTARVAPALLTIWFEQFGALEGGAYNWNIAGRSGGANMREPAFLAQLGYPMLCDGRLLRCGISAVGKNGKPQRHGVGVTLTVNGEADARFGVVIGEGAYSGWSSYVEPLEFSTGTRLGLVTSFDSPSTKNAVVNMLIEVVSL